jgi:hypothetical protein
MALTKTALIATLLTGLLGWTTPAWADDYSATTTIDLTTLTFSVVTTSYAPIRQKTLAFAKVGATEQANRAHDFGAVVTRNLTTTLAGTGNAAAVNDATHLSVVAHRTGSVGTLGMVEQAGELTATQTGVLTVSVNYTISHGWVAAPRRVTMGDRRCSSKVRRDSNLNMRRDSATFSLVAPKRARSA